MPEAIREHLFNLEKMILLYMIWDEPDELIQQALKCFQNDKAGSNKIQNYEQVICKRLISHSATRVKEVCKVMDLSEELQERVWDALLYVFRNQLSLMRARYIDQIIICSIYALKLSKPDLFKDKEIKFKSMITLCETLPHFNPEKVKRTPLNDSSGEFVDIITFYNKIYLIPMKVYFKQSQTEMNQSSENISPLHCQLNNSIPHNFFNYTPLLRDSNSAPHRGTLTPMTPLSQRLQAHIESPIPHRSIKLNTNLPLNNSKLHQNTTSNSNQQSQYTHNQIVNEPHGNKLINSPHPLMRTLGVLGLMDSFSENNNAASNTSIQQSPSSNKRLCQSPFNSIIKVSPASNSANKISSSVNLPSFVQPDINNPYQNSPLNESQLKSSPSSSSPKFGTSNSNCQKKNSLEFNFFEDTLLGSNSLSVKSLSFQAAGIPKNIKRQHSIFGINNPNFNSDNEDDEEVNQRQTIAPANQPIQKNTAQ